MTERKSLAVISVITVIACLFVLFAGISGYSNCKGSIKGDKKDLDELTERLDKLDEAMALLDKDADKYASLKADYKAASDDYDAQLQQHEADEKAYDEGVANYNQNLMSYSIGKNALGNASMLGEGKQQLSSGWDAYNEGLAAYEEGVAQFNAGKAQYDQLMSAISDMESKGMPHFLVMQIISARAGTTINDNSLAEMKAGIDEGQAQLDAAKSQLDTAKAQLTEGQAQLDAAEQKIAQGQAEINSIGSGLPASRDELDKKAVLVDEGEKTLEGLKADLDAQKEDLKIYESSEETISRTIAKLTDMGIAKEGSTAEEALNSGRDKESEMRHSYNTKATAFTAGFVLLLLDIAAAVCAIICIAKLKDGKAIKLAAASTVASVILCVLGTVRSLGALAVALLLLLACTILMILAVKKEATQE